VADRWERRIGVPFRAIVGASDARNASATSILGFYSDADGSAQALRSLRKHGFGRSMILRPSQAARFAPTSGQANGVRHGLAVAGSCAAIVVLLTAFLLVGRPTAEIAWRAAALLAVLWVGSSWVAIRRMNRGVEGHLIAYYRRWVLPGERLVIVRAPLDRAGVVLDLLRRAQRSEPATFVIRSPRRFRDLPDDVVPAERLAPERLKLHATELAKSQTIARHARRTYPLQKRMANSERIIEAITGDLTAAARLDEGISLATEWLLDNAYVIAQQSGDLRRHLSRGFYDVLPKLELDGRAHEPRVYELARELVIHTEAEVHEQDVVDFVLAYQEVSALTLAEIWALPLMLRLALIENLARLAVAVDRKQHEHERADFWANRLLSAARRAPDSLLVAVAELARELPHPSAYLADRLVSQLQGEALALGSASSWLERVLGASLPDVIQQAQREQAAEQVAITNAISSLRDLSRLDWRHVVERVSVVERELAADPSGVFGQMDFETRNLYRGAVERIARGSGISEGEVARLAVQLASAAEVGDGRFDHVGYYLIDRGRDDLEARTRYRSGVRERLLRDVRRRPAWVYLGGIGLVTMGVVVGVFAASGAIGVTGGAFGMHLLLAVLTLVPASELAVQLVNVLASRSLHPTPLPKLSLDAGIPDEWRTLVVVPVLFGTPDAIRDDLAQLEIRFLANRDANLHFALLADFRDATEPVLPEDATVLETSIRGVEQLNMRHPGSCFSLFYRQRVWSAGEQLWMGWERKRGKLEELNRWLLGDPPVRSGGAGDQPELPELTLRHVGDADQVRGVRFVLTLDADTQLPHGAARRLVGTLAHPLNRPQLAADGHTVDRGYAVIQPRVSTTLPSATATRFARLFAGPAGTDPYTHAISDVYQDLTGEGTYHGKGIYDLATFHRVLSGRFPPATLLSHDLLEGAHVRVGLATDIELFDQFPSTYLAYTSRQHRWIRGDWQISDWCTAHVPGPAGAMLPNPLSTINRWKILDNLRRSLVAPASVALLLGGWLFQPAAAALWGALVALVLIVPPTFQSASWLATQTGDWRAIWPTGRAWRQLAMSWIAALVDGAVLPYQAFVALDAIGRVWVGRWVSHRHALAWQTSQVASVSTREREHRFLRWVGGGSVLAVVVAAILVGAVPPAVPAAVPFLLLWLASPALVAWLDTTGKRTGAGALPPPDRELLRHLARRTWRYFDDFVGPQTSWLPSDNYQTALRVELAGRTSPTNIGLWLLSILAAGDLGYLTADQVIERGLATLDTLNRLERFEGHLLNWYDVQSRQPLLPRYVSTVDSGNLLASLWALGRGYRDLLVRPLIGVAALRGLEDTLALVQESVIGGPTASTADRVSVISDLTASVTAMLGSPPTQLGDILRRLEATAQPLADLDRLLQARATTAAARADQSGRPLPSEPPRAEPGEEAAYWAAQLKAQHAIWSDVVARYLPWVVCLINPPSDLPPALDAARRLCWSAICADPPSLTTLSSGDYAPWQALLGMRTELGGLSGPIEKWLDRLSQAVADSRERASETVQRARQLIELAATIGSEMNMRFLYDPERELFSIGYNVDARRLDPSHYDLLASESRLGSFVAIARGDVPQEHWLALGRPVGIADGRQALLSWTGTMFEYLMPLLLTRSYDASLLDAACRAAVAIQIAYGVRHAIPWGISEAAFSAVDTNQIYQYQAFGVPELGLRRDLAEDLVVAPYATALALLVDPLAAVQNLKRLMRLGLTGSYGFYESIDYSPGRQGGRQPGIAISAYMAHHQGMILVAIDNALHENVFQTRFHADPRVRAFEPLLFERIPTTPVVVEETDRDEVRVRPAPVGAGVSPARFGTPDAPTPRTQLLGNGTYAVMVATAGGGYSRWRDVDVSRWRADTTLDAGGSFIYVRDVAQGVTWSATHQPTRRTAERYSVTFASERAEFERLDGGISTLLEIVVSSEDDSEIRRLTLVNLSGRQRVLEVTSYVELALAPHRADRAHPAFSKLFVETAAVVDQHALLAWRKPRAPSDPEIWATHVLMLPPDATADLTYETDRARFLGRGQGPAEPAALTAALSNTAGPVLDPIFSLRCRVSLEPGQRSHVAFVTGAGETRAKVLALVEKYQDPRVAERELELAWFQAQLEPRHLRVTSADLQRFQQLASSMLYPHARLRAAEQQLRQNRLGQSRLWAYGISGDLPILLVTIGDEADIELVREALLAHTFWRWRGLRCDLVILNEESGRYDQPLQRRLQSLIQAHAQYSGLDEPGGIFLRAADGMPPDDRALLFAVARAVLVAARGPLAQQLSVPFEALQLPPRLAVRTRPVDEPSPPLPFLELPYFNGLGGFTGDGKEYAIYLGPGAQTPLPWVNVMANPSFGALVSESGQGSVWYGNSQSNRLVSWSNDPIVDPSGDAIYLRDEDTGVVWTPTARPVREPEAYRARHGQGYTAFEHNSHAIGQELLTFVPIDESGGAPVRIQRLRLRNDSPRRRRLSATSYVEWVLGESREDTQLHVVTNWDGESRAMFARNAYHPDYGNRVAFAGASRPISSYTADRTEFLGRNGTRARPAALARQSLSGRCGAGLDPCAALQVSLDLEPGGQAEVTFVLGQAADAAQARDLARRFGDTRPVELAFRDTCAWWDRVLGSLQVETPDLALNFLLNRWLLYQTLSCRVWARSAFYQSGGAFGFRDQLQDAMALVYAVPGLAREQILAAAARQFVEGDVQHWWHPQSGAGVRTRISDDLLWLPYVVAHYVRVTGDATVLDESISFLAGLPLEANETERYFVPETSPEAASLLEHCRRAIARAGSTGLHGLPLIGGGDWNDGLNLVGPDGKGESIWLAWFLVDVLQQFGELLDNRRQTDEANAYRMRARDLAAAVESRGWDGAWYRRAYFDDGTPLGSRDNAEARIDSLPQSWAVISGAADPTRAGEALRSVEEQLVREKERLILLFSPPFENPSHNPGYVQGYPPGVRENGGQYTHAAVWVALAFAQRGDGKRAAELLGMLNPVTHARTPDEVATYKVEPYVVAADVYTLAGHVGQGGWTWYTGSSGWLYRVWIEEMFGFKLRGDRLILDPVLPPDWPSIRITYQYRGARYEIVVENPDQVCRGVAWIEVDGERLSEKGIPLHDDGARHAVVVRLGPDVPPTTSESA
jgi:cyclic beta-1,2-glucan synthetase